MLDVDDLADRIAVHGAHAIRVAGMLARVAADVAGALEASRIDHACGRELHRDPCDGGAEVVHAWRSEHCGAALMNCDRHMTHLLEHAELPYLEVYVPHNRVRAWTARLQRAVDDVVNLDRRTLTPLD